MRVPPCQQTKDKKKRDIFFNISDQIMLIVLYIILVLRFNGKLKDIVNELLKPGYDVRFEFNQVKFSNDILDINDLKEGFVLSGIVRNITDFGAFVDIGLKNDALLHISQISEKRISHPSEVLSINQNLENLKVISIDLEKQRVGLSLK